MLRSRPRAAEWGWDTAQITTATHTHATDDAVPDNVSSAQLSARICAGCEGWQRCLRLHLTGPCANFDFCALRLQTFVFLYFYCCCCCCFCCFRFFFMCVFSLLLSLLFLLLLLLPSQMHFQLQTVWRIYAARARSTISFIYLSVHICVWVYDVCLCVVCLCVYLCVCASCASPSCRAFFAKWSCPQALGVRRSVSAVGCELSWRLVACFHAWQALQSRAHTHTQALTQTALRVVAM